MENINKFCEETGLQFKVGECGFGRPCVGIIDESTGNWLDFTRYDDDLNIVGEHKIARSEAAPNAYHKHDCLSVLIVDGVSEDQATEQLNDWIGHILKSGYKIEDLQNYNRSFISPLPTLKCLVDL